LAGRHLVDPGEHRVTALAPHLMLIGSSSLMREVREVLGRLAQFHWPVLILGPTGTGTSLAARLLHNLSPRASGPFVLCPLNMAVESLAVAELVGYVKGAFTGAVTDYMGKFEAAHGGTLFLDELALAIAPVERALLHLLETREVLRIGERRPRLVDVRMVFATNVDLKDAARRGEFREDLLHRLGQLTVRMPALKEHPEDIPEIAAHVLARYARELRTELRPLDSGELAVLKAYDWPGNVRELEKALQHFVVYGALPGAMGAADGDRHWRSRLDETLLRCNGVKAAAARELGVSRKTVHVELARRQLAAG